MLDKILHGYTDIPLGIVNAAAPFFYMIPSKYRYGKCFSDVQVKLESQEKMSLDEILCLQNEKLQKLIHYAYKNVRYYHNLFEQGNVSPDNIKDVTDLNKIPFLTKEIINKYRIDLISNSYNKKSLSFVTTSGTTGSPLGIYIDPNNGMHDWAYNTYLYRRVGWKDDCSKLMLRGKGFYAKSHGKCWQYDRLKRELSVDIFQMDEEHLELYCNVIERYRPDNIFGYISAITLLCKHIQRRNGIAHQFKGVYACSENILESERAYIESILNVRLFSNYGQTERVILAGECEYSHEYHIEPLYGVTELVDKNGKIITDNQSGELVGTGFSNLGMPLIRYKTGDIASYSNQMICKCGRCYKRLKRIEGRRKKDVLYSKAEVPISLAAINMHSNIFDNIKKMQFEQSEYGKVLLRILPIKNMNNDEIMKILEELDRKIKGGIEFEVEVVDDIPLEKSGKYQLIIQKIRKCDVDER